MIRTVPAIPAVDTDYPLGHPVWLLYLGPIVLSFWPGRLYAIPAAGMAILLFPIGGFLASSQGIPVSRAIVCRLTFFITFIAAAAGPPGDPAPKNSRRKLNQIFLVPHGAGYRQKKDSSDTKDIYDKTPDGI